jgi:hypothetical protein
LNDNTCETESVLYVSAHMLWVTSWLPQGGADLQIVSSLRRNGWNNNAASYAMPHQFKLMRSFSERLRTFIAARQPNSSHSLPNAITPSPDIGSFFFSTITRGCRYHRFASAK